MPNLTDQQRDAVTRRGVSIALSAGAGCGKTFVLTERFLAELEPGRDGARARLSQIAAITFTERAAREMRARIRPACRGRLAECPDAQAEYWLALIRDLDSARISTIHAFCASLLRAHAFEAGVDPRFRVLDGPEAETLVFEQTDGVLRRRLAEREEDVLTLAARFGLDRLREMIGRLLAVRQAIDFAAWRTESPEGLAARWADFFRRDTLPRLVRDIAESDDARTLLVLAARDPSTHPVMRARFDQLRALSPRLGKGTEGDSPFFASAKNGTVPELSMLTEICDAARVQGGGTKKQWDSEEAYAQFRDAAERLRKRIGAAKPLLKYDEGAARPAAGLALRLLALAGEVAEQYDREKRELVMLDFNDLLMRTRDLLAGPERGELRRRRAAQIRLLLVDEFQDTDPLQVELVQAICDNEYLRGKLFFVGDHKQ